MELRNPQGAVGPPMMRVVVIVVVVISAHVILAGLLRCQTLRV
jgi:hypothetical protein